MGPAAQNFNGSATLESHSNCNSDGQQDCVSSGSYFAATACNANAQDSCYLNSANSYDAADLTNLSAGSIKRGITIAGTTGNFPSSTSPLPRYSDSGATTNTSGGEETDLTTFITQLTTDGTFEYWDSSGIRRTGSGDSDITNTNVADSVQFENLSITGSFATSTCNTTVQGTCEADSACRWIGSACEINPFNIKSGVTIAGTVGTTKTNCRNRVNSSLYNYDGSTDSIPTTSTTAGSTIDWWDTIDNYNNNSNLLPTFQPPSWNTDNLCGKELWSDITADGACDSAADDCLMKDNVTGLTWSEGYPVTGVASAATTAAWNAAIDHCNDLTFGGITAGN